MRLRELRKLVEQIVAGGGGGVLSTTVVNLDSTPLDMDGTGDQIENADGPMLVTAQIGFDVPGSGDAASVQALVGGTQMGAISITEPFEGTLTLSFMVPELSTWKLRGMVTGAGAVALGQARGVKLALSS